MTAETSDLVKRLRDPEMCCCADVEDRCLFCQAADRIEALEAENAKLKAERDEADRYAGATRRELESMEESRRSYEWWLRDAKEAAGYPDAISFDVVWAEALAALKEKRAALGEKL